MTEAPSATNGQPTEAHESSETQSTSGDGVPLAEVGADDPPRLTADDLITDRALDENDPDRLRHLPIARELAELAIRVETPANIALFGPWGSGKSSVLASVRRILRTKEPKSKTVRYDAWKYGGSGLQRNFIFNAASELGLPDDSAHREFFRGLYEKSRTADIRFTELFRSGWAAIGRFVGLVLAALAVLWTLAAAVALASGHKDLLAQLTFQAVLALPWALLVPIAAGILQTLMQGARVEFEQSAPSSDEQFSRTFRKLIKETLPTGIFGRRRARLVFLIDELDRCSPSDVAATLSALKTFLDEKECVFIVAIDREALEKALRELPQAAPVDEDNPYYSSASSFIDKVFQHQISLPPLRTGRLTRLAAELVQGRGGVWGDLAKADNNGARTLELVLYALIPSHVRSPRRVKILLNNFATATRMVEARGIDWLGRSAELAKLIALRTEFPVFANDLFDEPRLPSLLLDPSQGAALSLRSRELVARYAAAEPKRSDPPQPGGAASPQPASQTESSALPKAVALDPPIAKLDQPSADAMARIQNQQLGRYLQRTARIKDPGRDLLYVESAGALADIQDSSLGQLVEDYAPDAPQLVLTEMASQPSTERLKALLLLMDMADREVGLERSNCVQVLLGVADQLGDDIEAQADRVAETINSYLLEQPLAESSLPSALRLACHAHTAGRSLERSVLKDQRLLANRTGLKEAAALIGVLDAASSDVVLKRLIVETSADPAFAVEVLPQMNRGAVADLMKEIKVPIQAAIATIEGSGGVAKASEFLDGLWTALGEVKGTDADLLADFGWTLLNSAPQSSYNSVRSHANEYLTDLGEPGRSRHALVATTKGPESDWSFWTSIVSSSPVAGLEDQHVLAAIKAIFTRATWGQPAAAAVGEATIRRIAAAAQPEDPAEFASDVGAAIQPIIGSRLWWLSPTERQAQMALNASVAALVACESLALIANDLAIAQLAKALPPTAPITAETYVGLRDMGALLSLDARRDLVGRIKASIGQPQPAVPAGVAALGSTGVEPLATIANLISVDTGHLSASDWGVATSDVCAVVKTGNAGATPIVVVWLRLRPPAADLAELAAAWVGRSVAPLRDAFKEWARAAGQTACTALALELIKAPSAPEGWIAVMAEVGLDEDVVIGALQSELHNAKHFERRQSLVDLVLELHPTTRPAQRKVGECALDLLSSGKKNDFELASRLGPALGDAHRVAGQLSTAFNTAISTHGWTIADAHQRSLEAAGVRIRRRRNLRDRLLGRNKTNPDTIADELQGSTDGNAESQESE